MYEIYNGDTYIGTTGSMQIAELAIEQGLTVVKVS